MSDREQKRFWHRLMQGEVSGDGSGREERIEPELRERFARASSQVEVEREIRNLIDAGADEEEVRAAGVRRLNSPELRDVERAQLSSFAHLLERNPRSMKRLMNAYGIERDRLLREGYALTRAERRQLALLTIFRLRWPDLAEHLRKNPNQVSRMLENDGSTAEAPFAALYSNSELLEVLAGEGVDATLDSTTLLKFPDRAPD